MRLLSRGAIRAKQREDARPPQVSRGAWYVDPFGKAAERWWDGTKWTQEVRGAPTRSTAGPVPIKRSVNRYGNAAEPTTADGAARGKSRVCRRCYGTGQVTYDTGITGKCPSCMGKGRTTPEDRRANLILAAIVVAIWIVLVVVLHVHAFP